MSIDDFNDVPGLRDFRRRAAHRHAPADVAPVRPARVWLRLNELPVVDVGTPPLTSIDCARSSSLSADGIGLSESSASSSLEAENTQLARARQRPGNRSRHRTQQHYSNRRLGTPRRRRTRGA